MDEDFFAKVILFSGIWLILFIVICNAYPIFTGLEEANTKVSAWIAFIIDIIIFIIDLKER